MRAPRAILALSLSLTLSACASSSPSLDPSQSEDSDIEVSVVNIAYDPATLSVAAGDTVTWTSEDSGVHHTVTSGEPAGDTVPGVSKGSEAKPDGVFDGDLADSGASFTFTFETAGTYAYFCNVHPSMTAEIVVK